MAGADALQLYFHPNLDVARAQLSRAMAGITTSAQRPNPSVSIGAGLRNEPGFQKSIA